MPGRQRPIKWLIALSLEAIFASSCIGLNVILLSLKSALLQLLWVTVKRWMPACSKPWSIVSLNTTRKTIRNGSAEATPQLINGAQNAKYRTFRELAD